MSDATTPIPSHTPHAQPDPPAERRDHLGRLLCAAHNRRGELCGGLAVLGRRHCRMHGGTQPIGALSPSYKHGRAVRNPAWVPKTLLQVAADAIDDSDLLNRRQHLANLEAQLAQIGEEWEAGGGGAAWGDLAQIFRAYEAESKKGRAADLGRMSALITEAKEIVLSGARAADAREEARRVIERARRLTETEIKRAEVARTLIRADLFRDLVQAVAISINKHVPDAEVKRLIRKDLQAVMETLV